MYISGKCGNYSMAETICGNTSNISVLANVHTFLAKPADYCVPPLIGDGRCQRMCNVPQNFYDNGDCCLTSIIDHYCHKVEEREDINGDCVCHEDSTRHPGLEGKVVTNRSGVLLFCPNRKETIK